MFIIKLITMNKNTTHHSLLYSADTNSAI